MPLIFQKFMIFVVFISNLSCSLFSFVTLFTWTSRTVDRFNFYEVCLKIQNFIVACFGISVTESMSKLVQTVLCDAIKRNESYVGHC